MFELIIVVYLIINSYLCGQIHSEAGLDLNKKDVASILIMFVFGLFLFIAVKIKNLIDNG